MTPQACGRRERAVSRMCDLRKSPRCTGETHIRWNGKRVCPWCARWAIQNGGGPEGTRAEDESTGSV